MTMSSWRSLIDQPYFTMTRYLHDLRPFFLTFSSSIYRPPAQRRRHQTQFVSLALNTETTTIAFDWSIYVRAIALDMASMIPQSSFHDLSFLIWSFFFLAGLLSQGTYKSGILDRACGFGRVGCILWIMDGWVGKVTMYSTVPS